MQARKFKNWTDEDFKWKWDGVEYAFPAGQETFLEDFKADHFASHLVDREMNKMNNGRGEPLSNLVVRNRLLAQCFPLVEAVTPAEALNLNEEVKTKKKKVEPEFEDLKVTPKKKIK